MNIVWDWNSQKLRASLNSRVEITTYQLVLRDVYPIVLAYVTEQAVTNVPYVAGAIAANRTIKFTAKLASDLASAPLILAATWPASGAGTATRYSADWACNTAELVAAIGTAASLALKGEFVIIRSDNTNEYSTQFDITIIPDVNRETDVVPAAIYPAIQQYVGDDGTAFVRLVNERGEIVGLFGNGSPYTFVAATGLWHPMTAITQDGIPTPAFGAGVNA